MMDQTRTYQIDPNEISSKARVYFKQHYNCAQSVLAPFARLYGMDLALAFRIVTLFGGGMGNAGQICGAVSGALMAIGLYQGISLYDREQMDACYYLAKDFQRHFKKLHGGLSCPGLLGWDIGNPQELVRVREEGLFHSLCPRLVGDAARIIGEMLLAED